MEDLVFKGSDGQVLTDSILIAKTFGKEHKHVLDSIRNILSSVENSAETDLQCVNEMFIPSERKVSLNNNTTAQRVIPIYLINRDGFTLLAMGFTGKKALVFKAQYIRAFNEMEQKLKEQKSDTLSEIELLVKSAQALLDHERRLKSLESKVDKINDVEERLNALEEERNENGEELLSISISAKDVPAISLRDQIRQLVNRYSAASNTAQVDVWNRIYHDLYYKFHISINSYNRKKGQTLLDVAEKNNILNPIFDIISNIVSDFQSCSNGKDRIRVK